jgi:flagellin
MLSLVNNLASLNAQNNLNNANNALNLSLQRLSSGLRINSGADDPAGLVISQDQQAQMSGLQAAITNTSNATNVVQTADGALNETNALLLQIRGLVVSAANTGATDPNMLSADQAQIANALQTITSIANSTQYGTDILLNGSHNVTASLQQTPVATVSASNTSETGNLSASAISTTAAGTYTATITTLGVAASVTGGAGPAIAAGKSEILAIVGVGGTSTQIQLNGGLNGLGASDVVNAVNQYQSQTGVTASLSGGKLALTAAAAGTAGNSYTVAETGGTGAGFVAAPTAFAGGKDVVGTILDPNGTSAAGTGVGNVLTDTTSGLAFTTDPTGTAGTISVNVTSGDLGNLSATAGVNTAAGKYTATITQLATQATLTGNTNLNAAGAKVVGANETDLLTINGIQVQLNGGATGLDANGAAAAINQYSNQTGVTASVYTTGGTFLKLASTGYGSAQKISVQESGVTNPGNPSAPIVGLGTGLATGTAVAGKDVQGTLKDSNGNTYGTTGTGNVLTAANGLTITTDPKGQTGAVTTTVTNNALLFQIGADAGQSASVAIQGAQANAIGTGVTNSSGIVNLSLIDVTNSNQSFADILKVIDQSIGQLSTLAGNLGAFQNNTLQATAANLQTSLQNTTAANSTIRDTNFASESAKFAQSQVLVQAGTQVLKNSNQLSALVLTLLQ